MKCSHKDCRESATGRHHWRTGPRCPRHEYREEDDQGVRTPQDEETRG